MQTKEAAGTKLATKHNAASLRVVQNSNKTRTAIHYHLTSANSYIEFHHFDRDPRDGIHVRKMNFQKVYASSTSVSLLLIGFGSAFF